MNLYGRTLSVLKPYWKQLVTASLSAALHALLSGMLVWMFGPLLMTLFQVENISPITDLKPDIKVESTIDIKTPQENNGIFQTANNAVVSLKESMKDWVNSMVDADTRSDTLVNFCWLIVGIVLLKNIFLYLQGFFMAYVQESIVRTFRDRLFEKYQRLSLDYFHQQRTGQIISRITNDVTVLNISLDIGFNRLVTDSISLVMFFSFLIILSWKLTLLAMIILPLVFGFIWFIAKKLRKYSERSQERMSDVNSVLEESINNIRIVKAFSMEKFEINKFFKATYNYFRSLLRMTRIRHLSSPINDILATAAGVIILLYAGSRIISGTGELEAGDFMTYLLAMLSMLKPVKSLSQVHIKIQEGMAAAERIYEVMDADEKVINIPNAHQIDIFQDNIRYDNVAFSYNSNNIVLDNISFEVKRGEVVAFVGPSGGGKSTLLDLLPRFYDPQKGIISIDGHDIKALSIESIRSLMGIVTQETYLFNDTVYNNIAYGLIDIPMDKVVETSIMANAHEFIEKLENGYDTIVGNRGVKLSGGQRQRIAIARALLKNPQILIFDEATSALDTEAEMLVQDAIDHLMENRTSLVIAHRLSTIKHANRIFVIDRGKIVEQGTHEELLSSNGIYNRFYSMQFMDNK
ncbi:MAG: ABC transporter ATP-binding protein [Candidatus Zixiibacteriota bacterium]